MHDVRSATASIASFGPGRAGTSDPNVPDGSFAEQLRQRSRIPVADARDIDGDQVVSKAEELVAKLREMAEQLTFEFLMRREELNGRRVSMGIERLTQLANSLTQRLVAGEPVTKEDVADIAMEAAAIYAEATSRADSASRFDDEEHQDDRDIDGRIDWRTDRAALAARRGALAARLESISGA